MQNRNSSIPRICNFASEISKCRTKLLDLCAEIPIKDFFCTIGVTSGKMAIRWKMSFFFRFSSSHRSPSLWAISLTHSAVSDAILQFRGAKVKSRVKFYPY